jgi:hypothetical protein
MVWLRYKHMIYKKELLPASPSPDLSRTRKKGEALRGGFLRRCDLIAPFEPRALLCATAMSLASPARTFVLFCELLGLYRPAMLRMRTEWYQLHYRHLLSFSFGSSFSHIYTS